MRRSSVHIDNRDADQMYIYYEARIEALKRRVEELEELTEILQCEPGNRQQALFSIN